MSAGTHGEPDLNTLRAKAAEVRRKYATGRYTAKDLCEEYGKKPFWINEVLSNRIAWDPDWANPYPYGLGKSKRRPNRSTMSANPPG